MSCSRIFSFVINNLLYNDDILALNINPCLVVECFLHVLLEGEREREREMDPLVRSSWNPQHLLMKSPSIPGKNAVAKYKCPLIANKIYL